MLKAIRLNPIMASFVLATVPVTALGNDTALPPIQPNAYVGQPDASVITSAVQQRMGLLADGGFSAPAGAGLKSGLDALTDGDVALARTIRDSLDDRSLDRRILTWAIAMDGGAAINSAEILAMMRDLSDWPGQTTLRRNLERAIAREKPDAPVVISTLSGKPLLSVEGKLALARAYMLVGQPKAAHDIVSQMWREDRLDARDETKILGEFGAILTTADHRVRMEQMLYAERTRSGERVAALADAPNLAKAWLAVLRNDKKAAQLVEAIPQAERGASYFYVKAKQLRRARKYRDAAAVMLEAPTDRASLVDPDEWWVERRVLSRELLDLGDAKTAYRLVAAHAAESPSSAADAEFHAGWYALRALRDPKAAANHFGRIAELAEGPITLSRAYYWLGRAAEAGGPGDAKSYYAGAASYGTAFYGQLAAVKLGRAIELGTPVASDEDRARFSRRQAIHAIRRLEDAGYASRAANLYRDLAQQLEQPGELALLAAMAEGRGDHNLALRVGKLAAARGIDIGTLSHPLGAIPPSADISGAGQALAYAIARQESEFNVSAVSGAGALGLLQLLPGTAQDVAKKAGLAYSRTRLTTDAAYNATLGSAFLDEQLGRFAGSYVLTFAGYNAGPRRAQDWVKKYGDPRGKDIDTVVDWIERIPFTETRSYVQRVMENYQVYKTLISGRFDLATDLVSGRG